MTSDQPARTGRRLHIAVVTETYPPEVNGVAVTVAITAAGLSARGHRVELIRPRQPVDRTCALTPATEEVLVPGVPVPGYPGLRLGLPASSLLRHRWLARRPDIVQVATEGPLGWSAVRVARSLGLACASDFHTNFHAYSNHYRARWLYRPIVHYLRALHNATAVTMVPTEELGQCLSHFGFRRIAVVPRGVDTRLFDPARRSAALRASWGAGPDTPVVLLVGRLAPEKNLDLLFRSFERMRARRPDARLVIVGDGPERARIAHRHPGFVYAGVRRGEQLAEHYASADIFLYPSLTETFGNVTVEAMASGLAIVAFDYAAAREHLRHDVNGLVAPFGDEAALVGHAAALVNDPVRIARLRAAARATAVTFDWARVLDALEHTLAAVAAGSPERAALVTLAPGAAP